MTKLEAIRLASQTPPVSGWAVLDFGSAESSTLPGDGRRLWIVRFGGNQMGRPSVTVVIDDATGDVVETAHRGGAVL